MEKEIKPGTVYPKRTLFLRQHVGEASSGKLKYEMATTMAGAPIIESKQTGKWYVLDWQAIITMAVAAGIDQPEGKV